MASPNRRFKIGDVCGTQEVVSVSGSRSSASGRVDNLYLCRCAKCGATKEVTECGLIIASRGNGKRCALCSKSVNASAHRDHGDHCPTCYDLPHRRPKTKPCKCGNLYSPDTFVATSDDAHACANLWLYASRELGPDAFSGLIEWL